MVPRQKRPGQEPVEEAVNSIYGDNYFIFNAIYNYHLNIRREREE